MQGTSAQPGLVCPPAGACQLRLALYTEEHEDAAAAGLYPFNAVRNRALQMVTTEVGNDGGAGCSCTYSSKCAYCGSLAATACGGIAAPGFGDQAVPAYACQAVLLLDTDLLVSREFAEEVGGRRGWARLRQQLEATPAVVLPAFQAAGSGGSGSEEAQVEAVQLAQGVCMACTAAGLALLPSYSCIVGAEACWAVLFYGWLG